MPSRRFRPILSALEPRLCLDASVPVIVVPPTSGPGQTVSDPTGTAVTVSPPAVVWDPWVSPPFDTHFHYDPETGLPIIPTIPNLLLGPDGSYPMIPPGLIITPPDDLGSYLDDSSPFDTPGSQPSSPSDYPPPQAPDCGDPQPTRLADYPAWYGQS